jgi:hemoglobin
MGVMVCQKCGLPDPNPKPLRCSKCGSKDFYESEPSVFTKKPSTSVAPASPAAVADSESKTDAGSAVTLFDKYGGVPVIAKLVKAFHKEIMARAHLAAYFNGIDMEHLAEHTVKYMAFVMGKPADVYTGRDMYNAHAKYHIHGIHFDEVADVLKDTLTHAGVAKQDIDIVMRRVESLREMIII